MAHLHERRSLVVDCIRKKPIHIAYSNIVNSQMVCVCVALAQLCTTTIVVIIIIIVVVVGTNSYLWKWSRFRREKWVPYEN